MYLLAHILLYVIYIKIVISHTIIETREKYEHCDVGKDGKIFFLPHHIEISDREETVNIIPVR